MNCYVTVRSGLYIKKYLTDAKYRVYYKGRKSNVNILSKPLSVNPSNFLKIITTLTINNNYEKTISNFQSASSSGK